MIKQFYTRIGVEIVALLNAARTASARSVNALMTASYREIGRRIVPFEQQGEKCAEYGDFLVSQLASDLARQLGRGFSQVESLEDACSIWHGLKKTDSLLPSDMG